MTSGAGEAQPLTSAEMRSVATALASKHLHLDKPECDEFRLATAVLATLDAARATQTAGLRERVRAAISDAYYEARNDGETMERAADNATAAVLAALATTSAGDACRPDDRVGCGVHGGAWDEMESHCDATTSAGDADGLDVERLAEALSAYWAGRYGPNDPAASIELNREAAVALADEYQRLREPR